MTKLFAALGTICMALMSAGALADDSPRPSKTETLAIGEAVPPLECLDDSGLPWKLSDYKGKKVVVLYFYPGDFTGGCIRQAQAFREGLKTLEDLDIEVVGVSGDQAATHQLFRQSHRLAHTLLADPEGTLAAQLGIPVRRQDKAALVRAIDLERRPLLDEQGKPITVERVITYPRWTLIIDREGKLVSNRTQVNPSTDADEVRKIVETLKR
jgi:peroxiredoxin